MTVTILVAVAGACLLAGWLAGLVTRGDGFGLGGNIAVAFIGGIIGAYLAVIVGLPYSDTAIGAALAALLCAFLTLAAIAEMRR